MGRLDIPAYAHEAAPTPSAPEEAVLERADRRLRTNAYLALKNVRCEFNEGVLTLRGCLPSYFLKQMAQTAVAHLAGVQRVANEIVVMASDRRESVRA